MTGIVGRLFREFAITLSVAVVVSAFVSLTLTPMMCARLLRAEDEEDKHQGGFHACDGKFFRGASAMRTSADCAGSCAIRASSLIVAIVTLVATILLYFSCPKGLLPQQDTGVIIGVTDAAQNISFKSMMRTVQRDFRYRRQDPDVASVSASVGRGHGQPDHEHRRLYIVLKPHDERSANAEEIIERLRKATRNVEGISLFMQAAQDVQIDARVSRTQFQYTLQDADAAELAPVDAEAGAKTRATSAAHRRGQRPTSRTACSSMSMSTAKKRRA